MTSERARSNQPTLSVMLCVNRQTPFLAEAVRSVLTQSDSDFEFLIAANGCGDDLPAFLAELVANDPRVRIFHTAIGQLAFNLNFLADQAAGDYLVRMDADDISEPCRLAVLRAALQAEPVDVLGSAVRLIDAEGATLGELRLPLAHADILARLPWGTALCHPAVCIRRDVLLAVRGYLGGMVSEDTDLWLRAVRHGARFKNLPDCLLRYRIHDQQSIASAAGYAEVAGHWLREFLLVPSRFTAKGLGIALAKCALRPFRSKRGTVTRLLASSGK